MTILDKIFCLVRINDVLKGVKRKGRSKLIKLG